MHHTATDVSGVTSGPIKMCPECQHPMTLVRVFETEGGLSQLAGFYCQPCQFAETVPAVNSWV